jgi:tripartite-type tricarboxylate transporter receptor subunit TctC
MMIDRNAAALVAVLMVCTLGSTGAVAQGYPTRPLTLVVPFPAGGSSDSIARILTPRLAERLGQPIVIENIGGAGGVVGTARVVRATGDGYTLLLGSGSEILINKIINPKIAYDAVQDLAPIAFVGTGPMVLIGHPSLPAANVAELIKLGRSRPDALSYASAGNGTPMHLAGELFKIQGRVSMLHVPYKGAPPAIIDVLGGQVPLGVVSLIAALPHIRAGKLRAYGLTTLSPSRAAPEIAPLAMTRELAGFDVGVWWGMFTPASTPRPIVERLEREVIAVLGLDDVRTRLDQQSITADGRPGAELARFMQAEAIKVRKVVEAAKITAE